MRSDDARDAIEADGGFITSKAADFDYWSKMPFWIIREAVSLCLGIEPGDDLDSRSNPNFSRILALCLRAIEVESISDPVSPWHFIHWAEQCGLVFPQELKGLVSKRQSAWMDWQAEAEHWKEEARQHGEGFEYYKTLASKKDVIIEQLTSELAEMQRRAQSAYSASKASGLQKSMNTLLKLVGGMAVAVYNLNPHDKRSDAVRQIQSDLDLLGMNMDADTIRKWTKEGAKLVKSADSKVQ